MPGASPTVKPKIGPKNGDHSPPLGFQFESRDELPIEGQDDALPLATDFICSLFNLEFNNLQKPRERQLGEYYLWVADLYCYAGELEIEEPRLAQEAIKTRLTAQWKYMVEHGRDPALTRLGEAVREALTPQPAIDSMAMNGAEVPLIHAEEVTPKEVTYLWEPYIPRGMLTAIDGDPGAGKSYLGLAIVAALSRGRLPGPLQRFLGPQRTPQMTLWCTGEEDVTKALVPRLQQLRANLRQVKIYDGLAHDVVMFSSLSGLEQRIQELKPALLVFDPLIAFMEADRNMNSANAMKQALRNLEQLVQKHDIAGLVMRHLTKDSKSKAIYRGLNSVALAATFRSMLLIDHDPTVQGEPGITRGIMAHSKSSYRAKGPSLTYQLDAEGFHWTGTSQLSANQLNSSTGEIDKLAEAKDFLEDFLKDGPQKANDVKEAAREQEGITNATLRRAQKSLKIVPYQEERGWYWELPRKKTRGREILLPPE
jgi:hypothetical protein